MAGTFWNNSNNVAENVHIDDTGEYYDSTEVEGALQEIGEDFESLDTDISNKLDISAPTVDNEVKTTKFNDTTDDASTRGEGTVKYNSTGKQLEFSDGVDWVPIGSQVTDGYDNPNPVMAQNIDGYTPYKDAAQTEPEDGTGGTPVAVTVSADITTPLIGDRSLMISKSAANGQGEGVGYEVGIDDGNLGKTTQLRFNYRIDSADYEAGDIGVYLYDIDNSNLMYLSQTDLPAGGNEYLGTFLPSDSNNYRIIFHVQTTNALAYDITVDNVRIGEFNTAIGDIGKWDSPLYENLTNVTNTLSLPVEEGLYLIRVGRTSTDFYTSLINVDDQTNRWTGMWGTSPALRYQAGVWDVVLAGYGVQRIQQWVQTENINLATDFTEYAYNTNDDYGVGVDTTSFGNGPEGVELPDGYATRLPGSCTRVVEFKRAIQPTDLIILEIYDADAKTWIPMGGGCNIGGDFIESLTFDGTYFAGIGTSTSFITNSKQVSVTIGQERHNPNSYWDFGASTNTPRWRVRKVSNGNMAEQPPVIKLKVQQDRSPSEFVNDLATTVHSSGHLNFDNSGKCYLQKGLYIVTLAGENLDTGSNLSYINIYYNGVMVGRDLETNTQGWRVQATVHIDAMEGDYLQFENSVVGASELGMEASITRIGN